MIYTSKIYPHILKDIKDWPIFKFADNRNEYKKELNQIVYNSLVEKFGDDLKNEISKCVYLELKRLNQTPWKVDPPDAKKFWIDIQKEILKSDKCEDNNDEYCKFQLKRIITRYTEEIFGDFKINTYKFARVFLKYLFNRLFNGFFKGSMLNLFKSNSLKDRIKLAGYIEETRDLFDKGVVIFLPTHQSNLDSMIIGYTIDYKFGLPAFTYGAGLNLFNFELAAFYMSRLGAYKVDRRKKNAIYFNTLLAYSKFNIDKNVNSIFFPGGTRSRSGEIETKLKTGLMGSLLEAQYDRIQNKQGNVFIVPIVLNYHSVLEAKPLIYSYLKSVGRKKYIARTKSMIKRSKPIGIFKSIYNIFFKKSEFVLSIGKPMDVFGNYLNNDGNSIDSNGSVINIEDYFKREGKLVQDTQRDIVYTKMLAKKIAESYLKYNVVLSSHLVSFVLFESMLKSLEVEDVFEMLKYKEKEIEVDYVILKKEIESLLVRLKDMKDQEQIVLSDEFDLPIDELIDTGIKKLGVYHDERIIFKNKEGNIKTDNFGLLYYYANRLSFLKSLKI